MENSHIQHLSIQDKEIMLIGTAHVSKDSALEVRNIMEEEKDYLKKDTIIHNV